MEINLDQELRLLGLIIGFLHARYHFRKGKRQSSPLNRPRRPRGGVDI
jgi:hypothetical protein